MGLDKNLKSAILSTYNFFKARNIPFVIVGALAPIVLIDMKRGDTGYGSRITRDVDCIIRVDDWDEYSQIKKDMLQKGFDEKPGSPEHRLFFENIPIDIIPFGDQLIKNGHLTWPESDFRMNMRGYDRLFLTQEFVQMEEGHTVPVVCLPLAVFLKIHTYYERGDEKDLEDIFYILNNYETIEISERRFDVSEKAYLIYDTAGAYLLGQDLRDQIPANYQKDLVPFFDIFADLDSTVLGDIARRTRQTQNEVIALIEAFRRGLIE